MQNSIVGPPSLGVVLTWPRQTNIVFPLLTVHTALATGHPGDSKACLTMKDRHKFHS